MRNLIVISAPERIPSEITKLIGLFKAGLEQFHVRKPDFNDFDMINYISSIPKEFHRHIVLHSHFHLTEQFELKGIQLGKDRIKEGMLFKNSVGYFGCSAHSFEEITKLKDQFTHFFMSPVYRSISKPGYGPNYSMEQLEEFLMQWPELNIIALGGITGENIQQTLNLGFKAAAMIGNIWKSDNPQDEFKSIATQLNKRPAVLSIAGFDPCSGAGISADLKTFEQYKVLGLNVCTAITYQNEVQLDSVDWLTLTQIKKQIEILYGEHNPLFVKIGLVESLQVLSQIIDLLKGFNSQIKIIWDPIIKSSSQFDFHSSIDEEMLSGILKEIYLITPNIPEAKILFGSESPELIGQNAKYGCKVLLKGGHNDSDNVTDTLIDSKKITLFTGDRIQNKTKHGTGCVLSSAICSALAKGRTLETAIKSAKKYTQKFIASNNGLLGYHNL